MPKLAAGSVAIVTGGASGFGFRMAKQLQDQGLHVAILDIEKSVLETAVTELRASAGAGGLAEGYVCDVSSLTAVEATAAKITADFEGCPIGFIAANAYAPDPSPSPHWRCAPPCQQQLRALNHQPLRPTACQLHCTL